MRHSTAATAPRRGRPQARRPTALDGASSALERAAWPPLAAAVRGAASAPLLAHAPAGPMPGCRSPARWPSLRRWLVCARGLRRRSAPARGREACRLPLARARGRRVCRRHCPAAASRERDLSPSPGQPPSTPARWPGLLGRARRARRALVALERARLRRSCADARSGSVVAGAPPLSGRHTQNCRREAAASGFPRDRLRPRRPPDCIGFLLHSFSFEQ